jgi:hypothetical protein
MKSIDFGVDFVVGNSNKLQKLGLEGKICWVPNVFTLGPTAQATLVLYGKQFWCVTQVFVMGFPLVEQPGRLPIPLLILPVQPDMNQRWETPVTFWNKPSENLLAPDQRGAWCVPKWNGPYCLPVPEYFLSVGNIFLTFTLATEFLHFF